uniref:Uncharacterized protein n=1 Tax=Setaria viridis TaxID=4556 RepID=A0A4U6SQP3_SETVI|nr:hypothetical protein SEVIR_9G027150v2 [Setaria viridis]
MASFFVLGYLYPLTSSLRGCWCLLDLECAEVFLTLVELSPTSFCKICVILDKS